MKYSAGVLRGLAVVLWALAGPVYALPFAVDSGGDDHDAQAGDHRCATTAGDCTLRAALEEANASPGADTITFQLPPGAVVVLEHGQLEINRGHGAVHLRGPSSDWLTIDANAATRVLRVGPGARATLSGLTLRNGFVSTDASGNPAFGGGIENLGRLTLTGVVVRGNVATEGAGGILNAGTLRLIDSSVSRNSASSFAGGVLNAGSLHVVGGDISDNAASTGAGGVDNRGTAMFLHGTVSNNASASGAGGIDNRGTLVLRDGTIGYNHGGAAVGGVENLGTLKLTRSTVRGNSSEVSGGLHGARGVIVAVGSVIAGNFGGTGANDPNADCSIDPLSTFRSAATNQLGGGTGCATGPADGVQAAVTTGIQYIGRVAAVGIAQSVTTRTLVVTRPVAAGDTLLMAMLLSSTSVVSGPIAVTDSAGNAYQIDRDQTDGIGRVLVISARNVNPLAVNSTITATFPKSQEQLISVDEFAGVVARDQSASAWGTTSSFSSGSTATTSQPVELLFGAVGTESGTPPAWASGWTGLPTVSEGSDRVTAAFAVSSSSGQFAAAGTMTGRWMAAITTYTAGPLSDSPPVARLSLANQSSPPRTVTADAAASTDTDATPIASYRFDFGDGTSAVTTSAPTATAGHTYALDGTYTVTLIATDSAGLVSPPATATITVGGPPPVDNPPIARLTVTNQSSPARAVRADASASTDADATPIASYRFDFGDGTAAVTTIAPTATALHTYAADGTYTVTLTATDTAAKVSAPVTASVTVSTSTGSPIEVYVGYYDTHHPGLTKPKPNPWRGSSEVTFIGQSDTSSGGWDTSAVRIVNRSGGSLSGVVVAVDVGSVHFALWGTYTIGAGDTLVVAQTQKENFDGSDTNTAGCFGCSPGLCITQVKSTIPVVRVTIGGTTTSYPDIGQVLNTHGVDSAGCPYTGTRNDESLSWQRIG